MIDPALALLSITWGLFNRPSKPSKPASPLDKELKDIYGKTRKYARLSAANILSLTEELELIQAISDPEINNISNWQYFIDFIEKAGQKRHTIAHQCASDEADEFGTPRWLSPKLSLQIFNYAKLVAKDAEKFTTIKSSDEKYQAWFGPGTLYLEQLKAFIQTVDDKAKPYINPKNPDQITQAYAAFIQYEMGQLFANPDIIGILEASSHIFCESYSFPRDIGLDEEWFSGRYGSLMSMIRGGFGSRVITQLHCNGRYAPLITLLGDCHHPLTKNEHREAADNLFRGYQSPQDIIEGEECMGNDHISDLAHTQNTFKSSILKTDSETLTNCKTIDTTICFDPHQKAVIYHISNQHVLTVLSHAFKHWHAILLLDKTLPDFKSQLDHHASAFAYYFDHAMPYDRGSAAVCEMILRALYRVHGYDLGSFHSPEGFLHFHTLSSVDVKAFQGQFATLYPDCKQAPANLETLSSYFMPPKKVEAPCAGTGTSPRG